MFYRIKYLVLGKNMSYLTKKKTSQILIKSHVCLIHWLTHRHCKWGPDKNDNLRQKNWFQFSHCEHSIYLQYYSSSICMCSIYPYVCVHIKFP